MKNIDLHVHSSYSDGTNSPAELVTLALSLGLSAFALTDHDTTAGLPDARAALAASNANGKLRIIPGVEISAAGESSPIFSTGIVMMNFSGGASADAGESSSVIVPVFDSPGRMQQREPSKSQVLYFQELFAFFTVMGRAITVPFPGVMEK